MKHLINKGLMLAAASSIIYISKPILDIELTAAVLFSLAASLICPAMLGISISDYMHSADSGIVYREAGDFQIQYITCQILTFLYMLAVFRLHALFFFIPVVCYDVYRYRLYISAAMTVILSIYMYGYTSTHIYPLQLCLIAISFVISIYSCHVDRLQHKILSMKDDTAEHDMLVAQNTRQLLESQDNMVLTATLSERNRIAREIHDNVGHMLTRSILQTGAIKVINKDDKLIRPLEQLQSTLDTAMDSMRKSVHDLHDESIDLKFALDDMIKNQHNLDISLDYDMSETIPKDTKYAIVNIVKEAITNTLKHSNGNHMNITLREHPAFYQLYISDNGRNAAISRQGMGLYGIQERIHMLGGSMKLSTENGFSLLITLMKTEDNSL